MAFRHVVLAALALLASLASAQRTFSSGLSQTKMTSEEQILLNYTLSPGAQSGFVNNWWATGGDRGILLSFYVDGEPTPSISVVVPVACGSGFGVQEDPSQVGMYSSMFFGKAANTSAFSNKIPVPFQQSIIITYKSSRALPSNDMVWLWARGVENMPLLPMYGLQIPPTARLSVQQLNTHYNVFDFVDIVRVPAGRRGLVLATQLTVVSESPNVLEGCYYMFPDAHATWENSQWSVLATGTEDYYESAFYWDGGVEAQAYSGITTRIPGPPTKISAYKIHSPLDPLVFSDGFTLKWRIGDLADAQNRKCTCPPGAPGCVPVGTPSGADVLSYAWVMTW